MIAASQRAPWSAFATKENTLSGLHRYLVIALSGVPFSLERVISGFVVVFPLVFVCVFSRFVFRLGLCVGKKYTVFQRTQTQSKRFVHAERAF